MSRIISRLGALACLATFVFSAPASAETIYGIAAGNGNTNLVQFESATPGTLDSSLTVTGIQPGEAILGIDFRPATSQLYALGSSNRLYTIDPGTAIASAVSTPFSPVLNGSSFGFDFNPMIDRIRVVSETDRNRVLNPNTGDYVPGGASFTNVFYGAGDPNAGVNPNVIDSAYTNNVPGAGATQLYGIDSNLNILVTQANNAGTLGTVGPLGINVSSIGGFDISGTTGTAYASFVLAGGSVSSLYTINLVSGAATLVGQIDGGLNITALTVAPAIPEPATLGLLGLGMIGFAIARRRTR